jgi:acetyl esterase/lipase
VSRDDPPFLIVHGDEDRTVPLNQSQLLHEALARAGVSAQLHTIRGGGHGQGFGGPEIEPLVRGFFDHVLKARTIPPNLGPATTSASEASPGPAAPQGKAGKGKGADTMTWEQVRRIEGVEDDGRVARRDFKGPAALFARLDRNGDGFVSKADFR